MKTRTKRELIDTLAARWKAQYWHPKTGWMSSSPWYDKAAIYGRLAALPSGATEEQVNAIIENQSWTQNQCDECGRDVEVVIHLGEEPDYESSTFYLCRECTVQAAAYFEWVRA